MKNNERRRLESVSKGSAAEAAGLRGGDIILEMNGFVPRDIIDVMWATQDGWLDLLVERDGETFEVELDLEEGLEPGLLFEHELFDGLKSCPNRCVFCFVDQQPQGLRPSLYVKDEDYRASFLHGNYITLTNLTDDDIERILEMRLSPLYVSVHATDEQLRRKLLGRKKVRPILDLMDELAHGGIEFYTQIVLIPGWNDKKQLDDTLRNLVARHPAVRGIAVVPVGLTQHRNNLTELPAVDEKCARETLDRIGKIRKEALKKHGHPLVYGADELFLKARRNLPKTDYYDDFGLLENGIGLMRRFLDELEEVLAQYEHKASSDRKTLGGGKAQGDRKASEGEVVIVTGTSAAPFFRHLVLPRLEGINISPVRVLAVKNQLMGESVTVAGLLSGQDILTALRTIPQPSRVLFCDYALLDGDGPFLDGMEREEISRAIGCPVVALPDSAEEFVRALTTPE